MRDGIALIDGILETQSDVVNKTQTLLEGMNGICPDVRDPICTIVSDSDSCNFDGIVEEDEQDDLRGFLQSVAELKLGLMEDLLDSRSDIEDLLKVADDYDDLRWVHTSGWSWM